MQKSRAKSPAKSRAKSPNPGPASKRGLANYIWCHARDASDGRLCTYTDDEQIKSAKDHVMRLDWNGKVNPNSLDKEHLCPRSIKGHTHQMPQQPATSTCAMFGQ
jgi:hypothetical protein